MMFLVNAASHGPSLLAIHRVVVNIRTPEVVEALRKAFTSQATDEDPEAIARSLKPGARTFGIVDADSAYILTLRNEDAAQESLPADRSDAWRALDVALLHGLVFEKLLGGVQPRFEHTATEAVQRARATNGTAFLVPPATFESVLAVAEAGDAMPQKSTYFIPKPSTGVVLRPLD
jgi:uncharacterized protein (DUF1015 family)